MKKIPGFYAWLTSILMFLSVASFAAVQDEVQLDYSVSDGIYVNMPTSGTKFLTVPSYVTSFKVFDDGGSEDDYSSNANGCLVIVSQGHSLLRLSGETEFFGGADDYFSVYDGTKDWTRELLRTDNPGVLTPLTSSRDSMSICFESGQDVDGFGLDLAVTLVPVYEIVFEQNADEGTLSSDKDFANSGATVTLTATPSAGYMLTSVNIVGADETPVTPTINDDKVTFTMPEGGVTVTPNFEKVTFDEDGCLANENMYYHMDCDAQTHVCTISQILTTSPDNMPVFKDFKCWHVTRYSHQECDEETGICEGNESEWDEGLVVTLNDDYSSYNVALASDIDLGGFDDAEGTCVADFSPLAATHSSFDGQDYSINGLCWKGGISGGFYAGSPSGSIENVTFKNAYIEVQGTDSEESRAGVISPALSREARISYVTIDGATVIGDIVGGVVGVMDGMQASVPSVYGIDVKNSTIRAALSGGALVGEARAYFGSGEYAFAGNSISGSGNLGGFVGVLVEDCSFASDVFVSDSGTTVVGTEGTGNVGGFAGLVSKDYEAYIMGGEEISIERISIIDGNLSGGENIGGLVGSAVVDIPLIIANNFVTSAIGTTGASKKGYVIAYYGIVY